jgi:hypothetical protein
MIDIVSGEFADPELHTPHALETTAKLLTPRNPAASALFRNMSRALSMLSQPFGAVVAAGGRTFDLAGDAKTVLISFRGDVRASSDPAMIAATQDLLRSEAAMRAVTQIGDADAFASTVASLPRHSVEYAQAQVFGERLDAALRRPYPRSVDFDQDLFACRQADQYFVRVAAESAYQLPTKIEEADGLFQPTYAGEKNALYAARQMPGDMILRKLDGEYALQVDHETGRQIIGYARLDDAVVSMATGSWKMFASRDYHDFEERTEKLADGLVARLVRIGEAPADYTFAKAQDDSYAAYEARRAHAEKTGDTKDFYLDSRGRDLRVRIGAPFDPADPPAKSPPERFALVPVNLPPMMEIERPSPNRVSQQRDEMLALVASQPGEGKSKTRPPTFQIQATMSELIAVAHGVGTHLEVAPPVAAPAPGEPSPETIKAIALFRDAVAQPAFTPKPTGGYELLPVAHEGLAGVEHLIKDFGPTTSAEMLKARVENIEELSSVYQRMKKDGHIHDAATLELAKESASNLVLARAGNGLGAMIPTRALHLDRQKTAEIIKALPDETVALAHEMLMIAQANSTDRLRERFRLNAVIRVAENDVAGRMAPAPQRTREMAD